MVQNSIVSNEMRHHAYLEADSHICSWRFISPRNTLLCQQDPIPKFLIFLANTPSAGRSYIVAAKNAVERVKNRRISSIIIVKIVVNVEPLTVRCSLFVYIFSVALICFILNCFSG
jgi:hypothetical protein